MTDLGPRFGIIGCGSIARRVHIPQLRALGAAITDCASRSVESAKVAAAEAGDAEVHSDWRDLLAADIDAVVIASPNALHGPQALAAVRAGKHVLLEKPFTISVAEADQVIAAATAAGVVVMTSHNVRYAPAIQALRSVLLLEELGSIHAVLASFAHSGPRAWSPDSEWFYNPLLSGGGALMDLGVHVVDTVRFLIEDDFATVAAVVDHSPIEQDAVLSFETKRQVLGTLHAGWRSAHGAEFELRIFGDKATAALDSSGVRVLGPNGDRREVQIPVVTDSPQAAFLDAIVTGKATSPNAQDGRAAVVVVEAAYSSARTGRRTEVA